MISRIFSILLILSIFVSSFFSGIVRAYEAQFFLVSAYYSPLPGQSYYLQGSYEAEIRMNGRGTHGASGEAVRPGMIAAPKNYPFGAKIALEGVGVGTVLDRGGAIVEADQSGSFTRLDLYMGAGEEGLCRAMKFGVQSVYGTIFTLEESEQIESDTIDFANFPANCDFVGAGSSESTSSSSEDTSSSSGSSVRDQVLTGPVTPESSRQKIQELKKVFQEVGYLIGSVNDDFDANLTNTIYRFQLSKGIVGSPYDEGAGYYGPKTRQVLTSTLYQPVEVEDTTSSDESDATSSSDDNPDRSQTVVQGQISIFDARITETSDEDDIRELQFVLKNLGYFNHEQDGVFDQRLVDAIYNFQIENKVIASSADPGAGYYGPKTRAALKEAYSGYSDDQVIVREIKSKINELKSKRDALIEQKRKEYSAQIEAMGTLRMDMVSAQVRELQKLLKRLGYMTASDTAIFGPATNGGLAAYQLDLGMIDTLGSPYAGILGPVTRAAIVEDLVRRFELEDRTHLDEIQKLETQIKELSN